MADYRKMYTILFQDVTEAISILQDAQRKTEEIYTLSEEMKIKLLQKNDIEQNLSHTKNEIKE